MLALEGRSLPVIPKYPYVDWDEPVTKLSVVHGVMK